MGLAQSTGYTLVIGLDAHGAVCRLERWQSLRAHLSPHRRRNTGARRLDGRGRPLCGAAAIGAQR
jgi:hypothetical protein